MIGVFEKGKAEIYDFYLEDDKAVIVCSPVEVIRFRHFRVPYAELRGPGVMGHQIVPRKNTNYITNIYGYKNKIVYFSNSLYLIINIFLFL